jgi:hypothetical protein
MQLDCTQIMIRERGWLDLLDLALRVVRAYAWPLVLTLVVGILPAAVFNAWLLADMSEPAFDESVPGWYLFLMLVLVLVEIPLATAPATLYLGEAVFLQRPGAVGLARDFSRALPQLLVFSALRAVLFLPVITSFIPFTMWPYLNEVVLLERNPLLRRRSGQMTTFRRVTGLHGGASELFPRLMASAAVAAMLVAAFWVTMQMLAGLLLCEWQWRGLCFTLYYPAALWMTAGYFTVVRFLGYLDLRIRREGWEVELMMRAEGARLSRELT